MYICGHAVGKCELKFDEALHIVSCALQNTLHESFVHAGDVRFLITTRAPSGASWYGRCVDSRRDIGLVVVRLTKLVIISVFTKPWALPQIASQTELLGELLRKEGL